MLYIVFWILHSGYIVLWTLSKAFTVQICSFLSSCLLLIMLMLLAKALPSIELMR